MTNTEDLEKLTQLATALLATSISDDEIPLMVENYVAAIDAWFKQVGDQLPQVLAEGQGGEFLALHGRVLQHAQSASRDVSSQLRGLMKHGKGILAYTDTMPKQLGVSRPRKG